MDKATLLKSAIRGEVDGYTFYNHLAEKSSNEDAKRRLINLRDDERRHGAILTELYEKYVGGEIGKLPEKGVGPLAEIFDTGKISELKTEMEFINLAIEAELATTKFYKESAEAVEEEDIKEVMLKLSDEENGHYEILMAEKEALAGNYFWFSAGDTAPMED